MSLTADEPVDHKPTLTPPASVEPDKDAASSSELSEPEVESDEREEILPDHYYDGGKIPVFKPVSHSKQGSSVESRDEVRGSGEGEIELRCKGGGFPLVMANVHSY